jgi:hypothetical protein
MPRSWWGRSRSQLLACIPVHRGLEIRRINGHHLDRAPRFCRHEDNGRRSSIGQKGQTLDELFVSHHPIGRGRQQTIYTLQVKGPMEGNGLGGRSHRHRRGPSVAPTSTLARFPELCGRRAHSRFLRGIGIVRPGREVEQRFCKDQAQRSAVESACGGAPRCQ